MKLPKLSFEEPEIDLWTVKPDVYIDLRPFPYGVSEQAYAYSFGGEVLVSPKEDLLSVIEDKTKLGIILPNNMIYSKFFLVSQEQDINDILKDSFGEGAVDAFYIADIGMDRAYVVNAVDVASKRIIESQIPQVSPVVVRVLPASFAVAQFLKPSGTFLAGTFLVVECRPYEVYLYACAMVEGTVVTLSSDVVKTNVKESLREKIIFMNHKAVRFYRADSILQVFVVTGENAIVPAEGILKYVSSALKGKADISTEVIKEPFASVKGAWLFEKD